MRESKASKEQIERRRQLLEDHALWCAALDKQYQEEKEVRMELRSGEWNCDIFGNWHHEVPHVE